MLVVVRLVLVFVVLMLVLVFVVLMLVLVFVVLLLLVVVGLMLMLLFVVLVLVLVSVLVVVVLLLVVHGGGLRCFLNMRSSSHTPIYLPPFLLFQPRYLVLFPRPRLAQAIHLFYTRCFVASDPGQIIRKGIYYYQVRKLTLKLPFSCTMLAGKLR